MGLRVFTNPSLLLQAPHTPRLSALALFSPSSSLSPLTSMVSFTANRPPRLTQRAGCIYDAPCERKRTRTHKLRTKPRTKPNATCEAPTIAPEKRHEAAESSILPMERAAGPGWSIITAAEQCDWATLGNDSSSILGFMRSAHSLRESSMATNPAIGGQCGVLPTDCGLQCQPARYYQPNVEGSRQQTTVCVC